LGIQSGTYQAPNNQEASEEIIILRIIEEGAATTNSIIERLGLSSKTVLTMLTMLELKNKIQNIGNNSYVIKK